VCFRLIYDWLEGVTFLDLEVALLFFFFIERVSTLVEAFVLSVVMFREFDPTKTPLIIDLEV
jgi:hypothetical protein